MIQVVDIIEAVETLGKAIFQKDCFVSVEYDLELDEMEMILEIIDEEEGCEIRGSVNQIITWLLDKHEEKLIDKAIEMEFENGS